MRSAAQLERRQRDLVRVDALGNAFVDEAEQGGRRLLGELKRKRKRVRVLVLVDVLRVARRAVTGPERVLGGHGRSVSAWDGPARLFERERGVDVREVGKA